MKYLFAIVAALLVASSFAIYSSFPDIQTEIPVIYWVTDPNPAREEQVNLFHEWLIDNDVGEAVAVEDAADARALHKRDLAPSLVRIMRRRQPDAAVLWDDNLRPVVPEPSRYPLSVFVPRMELRLDTGNRNISKQIIQSVSGVAGDVMDMAGAQLPFFVDMGVLADMTEEGRALGFDTSKTWPAIVPDITEDGRHYAFPCNVYTHLQWVNKALFREVGMEPPPWQWTFEQFERYGKEFVRRANEEGERQTVFFTNTLRIPVLHRSLGLSKFNETLTRCILDDERFVRALKLKKKWTYEDHLLPTAADRASFDTESGYGGATLQLFNNGNYAMFRMGRYALIQLRKFSQERADAGRPPLDLGVTTSPHGGFPNTEIGTRCAAVYVDGNPDLAKYFLAYLASEKYNLQIVRDADALPPNPRYSDSEAFRRPPEHPNEWGVHERFAESARRLAVATVYTPFATPSDVNRHIRDAEDAFMNGRLSASDAAAKATARINEVIERNVAAEPDLRAEYERRLALQKKIDERRAAGQPMPADWIDNVFYLKYYRSKGWLE